MRAVFVDYDHTNCALLEKYCPAIAAELERAGFSFDSSLGMERAAWQFLEQGEDSATKNYRVSLNTSLGTLAEARRCLGRWSTDLFQRSFLAPEKDMLSGAAFERVVLKPTAADIVQEGGNSTASGRVTMEAKALPRMLRQRSRNLDLGPPRPLEPAEGANRRLYAGFVAPLAHRAESCGEVLQRLSRLLSRPGRRGLHAAWRQDRP